MKLLPTLLLAAAPAFTLGTFMQEGTPQEGTDAPPTEAGEDDDARPDRGGQGASNLDIFGRPTRSRRNTLAERLLGGWQLTRMELAGTSSIGRIAQGFMNISDSYLSLEIHAAYNKDTSDGAPPTDIHATFTAEYRLVDGGAIECSTVIGSFIDDQTGELRWERANFPRRYAISQEAGQLILTYGAEFGELTRLYFTPKMPSIGGARDIFGRKKGAGSLSGELDIFGRPVEIGTGERDVFGREKPVTDPEGSGGDSKKEQPTPGTPPQGRGGNRRP